MEKIPILRMGEFLLVTIQVDMHDRLAMALHYASLQQWDDLLEQLSAAEKSAVDRPGMRWLRTVLLATMR